MDIKTQKTRARHQAKTRRARVENPERAAIDLIRHLPYGIFQGRIVGGFWPLPDEIDLRPLMSAINSMGVPLALPCTPRKGHPLTFRTWSTEQPLKAGPYGTKEPFESAKIVHPDLVLVPLLAFTDSGDRLGYGGGFYDRTLSALRNLFEREEENHTDSDGGNIAQKSLFTCGVAFDAQRTDSLPVDRFDISLNAILTETGYIEF